MCGFYPLINFVNNRSGFVLNVGNKRIFKFIVIQKCSDYSSKNFRPQQKKYTIQLQKGWTMLSIINFILSIKTENDIFYICNYFPYKFY
jgi:hypothetical protein